MLYKNISCSVKTFYGTEFKPGEIKEVPGYINHPKMIVATQLDEAIDSKQSTKSTQDKQKKSLEKPSVIQSSNSEESSKETIQDSDSRKSSSSKDAN